MVLAICIVYVAFFIVFSDKRMSLQVLLLHTSGNGGLELVEIVRRWYLRTSCWYLFIALPSEACLTKHSTLLALVTLWGICVHVLDIVDSAINHFHCRRPRFTWLYSIIANLHSCLAIHVSNEHHGLSPLPLDHVIITLKELLLINSITHNASSKYAISCKVWVLVHANWATLSFTLYHALIPYNLSVTPLMGIYHAILGNTATSHLNVLRTTTIWSSKHNLSLSISSSLFVQIHSVNIILGKLDGSNLNLLILDDVVGILSPMSRDLFCSYACFALLITRSLSRIDLLHGRVTDNGCLRLLIINIIVVLRLHSFVEGHSCFAHHTRLTLLLLLIEILVLIHHLI